MATYVRRILPLLLLAAGAAMVVYGAALRRLPVWEEARVVETVTVEREIEVPDVPPPGMPGGPAFGGPAPGGMPGAMPGGMPGGMPSVIPPEMRVKRTVLVEEERPRETERKVDEPEYVVVREMTVGGVTLVDGGELMRTYRRAEAGWSGADLPPPPSLCPT
jgi:hypothetical protein